jgi:hypothetical protein
MSRNANELYKTYVSWSVPCGAWSWPVEPVKPEAEVLGVGDFESVLRHSVEVELPFGNCRILDLETLIRAKEAMNRDHDRIALRQLREII